MTWVFENVSRRPVGTREALRRWIVERRPDITSDAIDDHTPLIEGGYLESLDVADLLLFVEQLRGRSIDVDSLTPGAFRDLDTLHSTFFGDPGP